MTSPSASRPKMPCGEAMRMAAAQRLSQYGQFRLGTIQR